MGGKYPLHLNRFKENAKRYYPAKCDPKCLFLSRLR